VPPGCSFHTRCPRARLIAAENPSAAVEVPDGRVPRRCAEDEPAPNPAPNGASVATCHFAGEHPFVLPIPSQPRSSK
jgi:oligopeptide transport system ATP-binding protein